MCSRVARVRICSGSSSTALWVDTSTNERGQSPSGDLPIHTATTPKMVPNPRRAQLMCQVVVELFANTSQAVRHGLDLFQPLRESLASPWNFFRGVLTNCDTSVSRSVYQPRFGPRADRDGSGVFVRHGAIEIRYAAFPHGCLLRSKRCSENRYRGPSPAMFLDKPPTSSHQI